MIPVTPRPEPASFDPEVRQRGHAYFMQKGIDPNLPLVQGEKIPAYWLSGNGGLGCLNELFASYNETCAYLGIRIERYSLHGNQFQTASVDHFVSYRVGAARLAYDWCNYRLSKSEINSRKGDAQDVIDPFVVQNDWFTLDLNTGIVLVNSAQPQNIQAQVGATIKRLWLNDPQYYSQRSAYFQNYQANKATNPANAAEFLRSEAPFVWYEAQRQNRL